MADADSRGTGADRPTSPPFLLLGLALAVVVLIVAFVVDADTIGFPVLALIVICGIAVAGYRVVTSRSGGDADSSDNIPRQASGGSDRPLGDTEQAHDELSPHDLPKGVPARKPTEEMAGDAESTTRGPLPGG